MNSDKSPNLIIRTQPANKFRFRYGSEKEKHGSLKGDNGEDIAIELTEYTTNPGEQIKIEISLTAADEQHSPHINKLLYDQKAYVSYNFDLDKNYICKISKISIQRSTKHDLLTDKVQENAESRPSNSPDPKIVCICFKAVRRINNSESWEEICKTYSRKIIDDPCKNLKISDFVPKSGYASGGYNMRIVCDNTVEKSDNIQVKFFNEIVVNNITYDPEAPYALTFTIPKYKNINIEKEVKIKFSLIKNNKTSNGGTKFFVYTPTPNTLKRKRDQNDEENRMEIFDVIKENFEKNTTENFRLQLTTFDGLRTAMAQLGEAVFDGFGIGTSMNAVSSGVLPLGYNSIRGNRVVDDRANKLLRLQKPNVLHNMVAENDFVDFLDNMQIIKKYSLTKVIQLQNESGNTCLHIACKFDRTKFIQPLMDLGVQPNIQNYEGNTALHIAVINKYYLCVRELLSNNSNINVNETNFDGFTPLHLAVLSNQMEIVKDLIENFNASLSILDLSTGDTILHMAVNQGNEKLVKYLLGLKAGDEIRNIENYFEETALYVAYSKNAQNIIQLFEIKYLN